MRRILEKAIENNVVAYAKKLGIESVKLNGIGKRSHPDRMFLGPMGTLRFIEFKRDGEEPTPLQKHLHKKWAALGWPVYVVDNVKLGRELVANMIEGRKAKFKDAVRRLDLLYPLEDRWPSDRFTGREVDDAADPRYPPNKKRRR